MKLQAVETSEIASRNERLSFFFGFLTWGVCVARNLDVKCLGTL